MILIICLSMLQCVCVSGPSPHFSGENPPGISLIGIVHSDSEADAVAIFKDEMTDRTVLLKIGEQIRDYRLQKVLEDRVLLRRNAVNYLLLMTQETRNEAHNAVQLDQAPGSCDGYPEERSTPAIPRLNIIYKTFDRSAIENRIDKEWKNILFKTRVVPAEIEGRIQGLELRRMPDRSLLYDLSLRRNDIIREINGYPLTNPQDLLHLYYRIQNDNYFEVIIERGHTLIKFCYILD